MIAENQRLEAEHLQMLADREALKRELEAARVAARAAARLHRQRCEECAAMLAQRWPRAFCEPPVPLAIGVTKVIIATLRAEAAAAGTAPLSQKTLRPVMARWCGASDYLRALAAEGSQRCDLDGAPVAAVSEADRVAAASLVGVP